MIYLQLFYTFFKIGLFGFGGGYAMLSMIQGEVVTRYGWVSSQEFTDTVHFGKIIRPAGEQLSKESCAVSFRFRFFRIFATQ